MFVSELVKTTILDPVDGMLSQMTAMLHVQLATLVCNCAASTAIKSACHMMIDFCDYWSGMAESVGHESTKDIRPLADAMQSLLQTFKTAGESAQVTHAVVLVLAVCSKCEACHRYLHNSNNRLTVGTV